MVCSAAPPQWEPCGWGGGGFYYAAAFHPTREGVLYLGGDVGGIYKSENGGKNWRMINKGLAGYGVFTIAVDQSDPDTVYAAVEQGLCKSTNAGEQWTLLPQTGRKELRITGEKNKSIRSVAVDPTDGNIVYAANPIGKIFKSADGGQTWKQVFTSAAGVEDSTRLAVQFGKVNGEFFGGIWAPIALPASIDPADVVGFGFNFKGDASAPKDSYTFLTCSGGIKYRSKNLKDLFADNRTRDVILAAADFVPDPDWVKKNPDKAASTPATPDWGKVSRIDISCSGPLPDNEYKVSYGAFFFAASKTKDGKTGSAERPILVTAREFSQNKSVQTYGNLRAGAPSSGPAYSVAVAPTNPSRVAAATNDSGLIFSTDKGETWTPLSTPPHASSVVFDPKNADILYASFFKDGVWKSSDAGKTWTRFQGGLAANFSAREVAVNPMNPQDLYVIGQVGWSGNFYISNDGGANWRSNTQVKADYSADPTLPASGALTSLSIPTNIAINPRNPKQLYISANWRPCISHDGGISLEECVRGADISCITDIRFSGDKTYVTAMDEGTLVSEDQGQSWRQLWPLKHTTELSGHNWRISVSDVNGVDRLVATASPWDGKNSVVVVHSEDGGESFKTSVEGIPGYRIAANTMWGRGYPRALAVHPTNPKLIYMGIDGDPTPGQSGGGIFKSVDGGATWKQLANQPTSRRMYYGLAIDPVKPERLYWAAFGNQGGVHLSEDGGESWRSVFNKDAYLFNILVTPDGTVYVSGKQLYRSTDHGKTWTQITKFEHDRSIVGLEVHPKDPKTIWISSTVWSGAAEGAIYKTTDGGSTWAEITGDIPYIRPQILRFNPRTNELWAGNVGLYKIRQ